MSTSKNPKEQKQPEETPNTEPGESFYVPECGVSVRAKSHQEAVKKAKLAKGGIIVSNKKEKESK